MDKKNKVSPSAIHCVSVSKSYGETEALKDVTFDVTDYIDFSR